jgi:hypothetical protein
MQMAIVTLVVILGTLALPAAGAAYQAIETCATAGAFRPQGSSYDSTRDECTSTGPEKARRLLSSNQAWAGPA